MTYDLTKYKFMVEITKLNDRSLHINTDAPHWFSEGDEVIFYMDGKKIKCIITYASGKFQEHKTLKVLLPNS